MNGNVEAMRPDSLEDSENRLACGDGLRRILAESFLVEAQQFLQRHLAGFPVNGGGFLDFLLKPSLRKHPVSGVQTETNSLKRILLPLLLKRA
ncbi:MAG: hypothetical protein ABSH38_05495 [Verrucomicrobiota bacterium]|jgi:hypothetical protein